MKIFYSLIIASGLLALTACDNLEVDSLKCEHLVNPVAIDNTDPMLSWKLHSDRNGSEQSAYQILAATDPSLLSEKKADLWNSGKVASGQSINVSYGGRPLGSRSQVYWTVRVWDENDRPSDWSDVASFGVGLLNPTDWSADYIGMDQTEGRDVSPIFRKRFTLANPDGRTIVHVNSLGYHEVYVNGDTVNDAVLTPAVSQFNKRSQIVSYDISDLIREGDNDIVILAGKGWYQDGLPGVVSGGPYVRAQVESLIDSCWTTVVATDSTWTVRGSGYESFGNWRPYNFGGERVFASQLLPDYTAATLDTCNWWNVKVADGVEGIASPQMVELNRIKGQRHPVSVIRDGDSSWIYDMGTNLTGWTRIAFTGLQPNQEVRISYCDFLDDNNKFRDGTYEDYYIASGKDGEEFINKFNYKAYRYLKLSNLAEAPDLSDVTGYLIHTDYSGDASFSCSDEDINAIYNMIHYTLKCLTLGGDMVDCPTIERLGYGGDGNASTVTVQALFDMAPTYANWLSAWADCMREEGSLPNTAPNPYSAGGGPYWCAFIVMAPWNTYVNYGDVRMLQRYYPYMQKWLGYLDKYTVDGLLKPWPDTDYRGWYIGDWATPEGINQTDPRSIDIVDNCCVSVCLQTMSKIAKVLGLDDDSAMYAAMADARNELIHSTFFDASNKTYSTATQIDMIYPMLAGATPADICDEVEATMKDLTASRFNGHLATGLVGIPIITEWAVKNGEAQFVYDMLKKREYPGYLFMIDNGATTTWEHWDGQRSRIHNCYNAIGSWFYQALAGIRPDENHPGYEEIYICPQYVDGISWVKAHKETPYGRVSVDWKKDGDMVEIDVEVPVGSTANLSLPDGTTERLSSGKHHVKAKKYDKI